MRSLSGLGKNDPFMHDIMRSMKTGFFDRRDEEGPSKLESTSVFELLNTVSTMSPERRRIYLGRIGRMPAERVSLSGIISKKTSGKRRKLRTKKERDEGK